MRQIFLDTETTGLDPKQGHRVVEVAGVEMLNRRLTGRHFHRYLNPEREMDARAQEIHGLSDDFLADKPRFREIAQEFLEFVSGSELVIHNAPFDIGFLDSELGLLALSNTRSYCPSVVDTLALAKELHPGKRNNLDALCERYGVNHSKRTLHGALLDAELLAEVYLAMTRGQETLVIEPDGAGPARGEASSFERMLVVLRASEAELADHHALLEEIDKASRGGCIWKSASAA